MTRKERLSPCKGKSKVTNALLSPGSTYWPIAHSLGGPTYFPMAGWIPGHPVQRNMFVENAKKSLNV